MNTQFLTTFVTVVERGSMAAAARLLNITPAAVAQQIRTLEREIGAPLIARAGRTVSVTEAGMRILERSRELLRDVADLRTVANDEETAGELRLGAGTNALTGVLPDILVRMVARFPLINVFIKPGYSPELYRAVESGELDAASDGRQAILLIGSTRGPIEKAERLSVASGAPTTHALPAFPMPLSAARVAVRSDAVYVAGTDANGMPRLLAIDPGAADPKWTTHAGWRPGGGELTSLVSQTSAVFATLRNDAGQGDRMLRWTSGEGWSERQALQGTVQQDRDGLPACPHPLGDFGRRKAFDFSHEDHVTVIGG